jgi:hypothetical protein
VKPEIVLTKGHSYAYWSPLATSPVRNRSWRDWVHLYISFNSSVYWLHIELGPLFLGVEKFE